jgi:ParB family transcriptional regulator, chromosome partitioning protein
MSTYKSAPQSAFISQLSSAPRFVKFLDPKLLRPNPLSLETYGDPSLGIDELRDSISLHGILVPLVIVQGKDAGTWTILSGHRRWSCALSLELALIPCEIHGPYSETMQQRLILEYNRQRRKTFTHLMREADILERLLKQDAKQRRFANLHRRTGDREESLSLDRRNSDTHLNLYRDKAIGLPSVPLSGRTDVLVAQQLGLGGKDLYRQARAIWEKAQQGDIRAQASVALLDAGAKTIYAAYKDLRRRIRFTTSFKPTPYDVWTFRHDQAFGTPHPGSVPAGIIAHTLHYFSPPGGLVIDPMAGGGTVIDVCEAMGRRCLAYDLVPTRPDIRCHDISQGFPQETANCDLIFCDPPYYTMLAAAYTSDSISSTTLCDWIVFLRQLAYHASRVLRPGGIIALLLAPQTEKDIPAGHGYLDHTFLGYLAMIQAGLIPVRRISCPMSGGYLPQHVQRARAENRLLGQVRDLLILRKPADSHSHNQTGILALHSLISELTSGTEARE